MRNLKQIGTYLENKARLNRDISIPLILIGLGGLIYSSLSFNFGFIFLFIIILFVVILFVGGFFLNNYSNYKGGLEAENLVILSLRV
jgi:hypothetical protein